MISMDQKRKNILKTIKSTNRQISKISGIMCIIGTLVVANVLFTMVTHKHIWSGKDALNGQIASSIVDTKIEAARGTIYDRSHNVIAQEVKAYTIVAYLDKSVVDENGDPNYVKDPKKTAKELKTVLDSINVDTVESIIKTAIKNSRAQTELGSGTKRLDKETKEKIDALHLDGIAFVDATDRYYPTTPYSSNLVGFATFDEDKKKIEGKMGLEQTLNSILSGKDGRVQYQQTIDGTKLPGTTKVYKEAVSGKDVVLTIDTNLQSVIESQLKKTMEDYGAKSSWCLVMEVETGKILGWGSYPTFDQNEFKEIPSFLDYVSQASYEPGSVMKPFTYATAIDTHVYPNNQQYQSHEFWYNYDPDTQKINRVPGKAQTAYPVIADAEGKDYGTITFDEGLAFSSNVAICELLANYVNYKDFNTYLDRFGFFKPVNSPYIGEVINSDGSVGTKNIGLPTDYMSTGFGQSSSVTALQLCQAYSAIFNDGNMIKPYVVDSIEDPETGKVEKQYTTEVVGTPISKETASQMKDLMKGVMEEGKTGHRFQIEGVDMIAKTGTGEIWNTDINAYDETYYTSSVMAAAPYENPKVMVYWGMVSSEFKNYSSDIFKTIMQAALISNGISGSSQSQSEEETYEKWETYEMPSCVNHSLTYANQQFQGKKVHLISIGDGQNVLDQYPKEGTMINSNDHIFLYTDGNTIQMPNMIGWTRKDITAFWQLTGFSIEVSGYGKVKSQNIEEGQTIQNDTKIVVELE